MATGECASRNAEQIGLSIPSWQVYVKAELPWLGAAQLKCHDTSKSSDAGAFAIYIGTRTMVKIRVRVSYRSLVGNKLTIGKSALKETAGVSET